MSQTSSTPLIISDHQTTSKDSDNTISINPKSIDQNNIKVGLSEAIDQTSKIINEKLNLNTDADAQNANSKNDKSISSSSQNDAGEKESDSVRPRKYFGRMTSDKLRAQMSGPDGVKVKGVPVTSSGVAMPPKSGTTPSTKTSSLKRAKKEKLRMISYLSPGVPLVIFEALRSYLEKVLDLNIYLLTESRWSGPPPERDPFTDNDIDMAFVCSTAYLRLKQSGNQYIELCPAAPLHAHAKANSRPVYFSDIVCKKQNSWKFKDFEGLRGCRWAYNDEISLSGNLAMLAELRKRGYNANFFGTAVQSGSHMDSLWMILDDRVDAASIDTNTLSAFLYDHPEYKKAFHVVHTLGPLPIYPILFNSRLSSELKDKITQALLNLNKNPEFGSRLLGLGLTGYAPIDPSLYEMETDLRNLVKDPSLNPTYY